MELQLESTTLSSLVRRAFNPTHSILICFSRKGGGVLAQGFLCSLYRRVQGILRSLILPESWDESKSVFKGEVDLVFFVAFQDGSHDQCTSEFSLKNACSAG